MTGPDPQALDAAERTVRRVMADGATYADSGYIARAAVAAYVGASSEQRPAPGLVEAAREAREVMERFMAISPSMQEAVRKIDAELGENDERP